MWGEGRASPSPPRPLPGPQLLLLHDIQRMFPGGNRSLWDTGESLGCPQLSVLTREGTLLQLGWQQERSLRGSGIRTPRDIAFLASAPGHGCEEGRRGLSLSQQPEVSLVFPLGADPGAGSCRAVNNGDGSSGKPNMGIVPLGSCFSPLGRGVAAARSVGMLAVGMGQGLGSLQGSKPKIETFFSAGLPALLGKESKDVTI